MIVPDDNREHDCVCGEAVYRVGDNDGYLSPSVFDDEGQRVSYCHRCGVELEPGP